MTEWQNKTSADALLKWEQPNVFGDIPAKRSGHSMVCMGNTAYVFGGLTKAETPGPNNDLYLLKIGAFSQLL